MIIVRTIRELEEAIKVPGVVCVETGCKIRLESSITLASGCTILSEDSPGGPVGYGYDQKWLESLTQIQIPKEYTINLSSRSSIKNISLINPDIDLSNNALGLGVFQGTALSTIYGSVNWDICIDNILILGFYQAVLADSTPRIRIRNLRFDCINGIHLKSAEDCVYYDNVQGWPYCAAVIGGPSSANRPGVAFFFDKAADGGKISNCFSYGHMITYHIKDASYVHLNSCGADGYVPPNCPKNSIGVLVTGNSSSNHLINCQLFSHDYGVVFDSSDSSIERKRTLYISDCNFAFNQTAHIQAKTDTLYSFNNELNTSLFGCREDGGTIKTYSTIFKSNKHSYSTWYKNIYQYIKNLIN